MIKTKEFAAASLFLLIAASFVLVFHSYKLRPHAAPIIYYNEISVSSKAIPVSGEKTGLKQIVKSSTNSADIAKEVPAPVPPLPIVPPQILNSVIPVYPETAFNKGVEGVSLVAAQIGIDGSVKNIAIKTSSGNIDLDNSAMAAVSSWKFIPSAQGGAAIASVFEVPIKFVIK